MKMTEEPVNYGPDEDFVDEYHRNLVRVGKGDTYLPSTYLKFAESIKNFEVRSSDVIVAAYPKTGTTWTQEMVWLIANDLDFKGAEIDIQHRFPYLEIGALFDWDKIDQGSNTKTPNYVSNSIEYLSQQNNPRFIKTHLPFCLLPDDIQNRSKSPKIIYITRNPKDACLSHYHQAKLLRQWIISLEHFVKIFLAGRAMYGSYWKHVLGYWDIQRNSANVLFIKYEDMKKDLAAVVRRVSKFLDKNCTGEQLNLLVKHLSFESMKDNKAVNYKEDMEKQKKRKLVEGEGFMRSGSIGKYKEEMSPESIAMFNEWISKNIDGTDFGLQCDYHLQ